MGKVIQFATDTLRALVGGLGDPLRDKAAGVYYGTPVLTEQELVNAYRGSWLPRKIVDIPALDSTRKWRDWQAEADQIEKIEEEEKRLGLKSKVYEARIKARLFGGAAIYIAIGDGDPSQELTPDRVKAGGVKFLTVMTRRTLKPGEIENDPESPLYGRPKAYSLTSGTRQVDIHPSRLVRFVGAPFPDDELAGDGMGYGWGDSVLTAALDAIKNADSTSGNVASLIFEAKIDVVKVPQLMASLSDPLYRGKLLERFGLAAIAKGNNGTLILDSEEEYQQKSASFQTLPDVMDRFLQIVAGAADIPLTRLLGTSPGGMNSTGEADLRNYYDRISSMQQLEMQPAMQVLDECLIRSALGSRPPEVHYIWSSLWQISDKERSEIGKAIAETISTLTNTGLYPQEALATAGATALTEQSILPGLEGAIEDAGGLPDYDLEAEREAETELAKIEAAGKNKAVADAAPRSLYIRRDVLNPDDIRAWARGQGFETVQDGLHVTIMFTRTPLDWIKVGASDEWSGNDGKIEVAPGGPRMVERFGDAVVLQFASSRLTWRHEDIKRLGAQTDHPEYQPHVTISWDAGDVDIVKVDPYKGKIVLGPEIFEEVKEDWKASIKES